MAEKWRILLLDTKKENPNHYIALALYRALKEDPGVELTVKADYGNAIDRARENRCNLFFAFDGEEIEAALCDRLGASCGKSIAWYVEDPYEIPVNKRNATLFDLVFTNDIASVHEYGAKGRHLPLAACSELHFREVKKEGLRYDLFFAGTAWPNRIRMLKEIERRLTGIRCKFALPRNEHLPHFDLDIPPSAYAWRTPNTEFAGFANRSAIVLLLHRQFSTSGGREEAATPGPRLFEVALAGGFQLVDRQVPGVSDYLREGKDYAAFSTPEECIEKINYYLENDGERRKMARSAQQRVQEHHTYAHRVRTLLAQLEGVPDKEKALEPAREQDKPCILMVCHNVIGGIQYGGVEIYLELIRRYLSEEYGILYYLPDHHAKDGKRYLLLDSALREVERIELAEEYSTKKEYILSCSQRERAFAGLLYDRRIDLVHFQHLIGHVPSLPYIAKAMGVPTVYSMHDYYSISHRFNLIDNTGQYQPTTFTSIRNTDSCLAEGENIMPGSQARRLAFWGRMLSTIDLIHANSDTTRDALLKTYPQLHDSNIMLEGIPLDETQETEGVAGDPFNEGPLEVLVLGNFTRSKGAEALLRVFDQTRDMGICFHVHGRIDIEYQDIIDRLDFGNVRFHAEYDNRNLESILKGKQVSLHLSVWPETYCITLSECWRGRLVPVVTDIGALGERVKHGVNGFKTAVSDVGAVVDTLQRLSIDRELLSRTKANIGPELYIGTRDHMLRLSHSYKKLITQHSVPDSSTHYEDGAVDLRCCGVRLNSDYWAEIKERPPLMALNQIEATAGVPRHPYYLMKFMLQQIRSRGFRITAEKVFKTLKSWI